MAGTFVACKRSGPDAGGPNPVVGRDRKPTAYLRTNWSQDPFALGAYSYVSRRSPGTGESDRAAVEAPIDGRVFFAGEALNPNFHGTVHAAHESGLRAVAAVQAAKRARVAVIGGGMAGLTVAARLTAAGTAVTVFEARDRLGGRIQTDRSLGAPVDLGATWIHGPEGNPLTALADQSKMPRRETDDTIIVRGDGGRELGWLGAPSWLEEIFQWTPTGAKRSDINAAYLSEVFPRYGLGYSGPDLLLPEGYDKILQSLAGDYRVRMSSPVARVESSSSGVKLTLRAGQTEAFDAVIVTVPVGVLKAGAIAFDPPLPAAKQSAIERMGHGDGGLGQALPAFRQSLLGRRDHNPHPRERPSPGAFQLLGQLSPLLGRADPHGVSRRGRGQDRSGHDRRGIARAGGPYAGLRVSRDVAVVRRHWKR